MAHYPETQDSHDTEEETYMHWLDKNGFPQCGSFSQTKGCEDVAVLRSVPTREALGVFRAVSTRDGEARARDREPFFMLNRLDSRLNEPIVEIQFGDGLWMLASEKDLETCPSQG
jgi:hypothetical protein